MCAAEEGAPQCFLLTPKLLSGLDYNEHTTILGIFNGPHIGSVSQNFQSVCTAFKTCLHLCGCLTSNCALVSTHAYAAVGRVQDKMMLAGRTRLQVH